MILRKLAAALLVACLSACNTPTPLASRESPYGLWSTERGQTVEVRRDGTFLFCDGETCEVGRYEVRSPRSVWLLEFSTMAVTERLRQVSGWEPPYFPPEAGVDPIVMGSFQLGDGGMSEEFRHMLCQDRPCRVVGRAEGADIYRFVKIHDL